MCLLFGSAAEGGTFACDAACMIEGARRWVEFHPGGAEMETYFTVKRVLLVLCLLAMPALAGCQTTAGFGRDVQQAGRWIEGGAKP